MSNHQRFKRSFYVFNYTAVFINRFLLSLSVLRQVVAENKFRVFYSGRKQNVCDPGNFPKQLRYTARFPAVFFKLKAVLYRH